MVYYIDTVSAVNILLKPFFYSKHSKILFIHVNIDCLQTFAPNPDASIFYCKEGVPSVID